MKIQKILYKPHPFIFNRYSVLLPSMITFLILVILKPFEFDTFHTNQLILWSVFFAVFVGITVFFCVSVIKRYFLKTIEENWTVKKEILLILFVLTVISLVLFVLFLNLNPQADRFELFQLVVLRTVAISFFPVLILVLYEQSQHQKIKRRQAERLNQELLQRKSPSPQKKRNTTLPDKIVLVAENNKIALQVTPIDVCFIKSEGNYVEVFYYQNQKIQKELIRNSLKTIEEQVADFDFFRCHNRFLVSLHHIQKVEGNARNFELILENIEEKIPVSRSKSERLLQLLQLNS
ncbi:LytR/AlgR family response regulator transcription factor [Planktosalinus lacus]|nr:LytTR family DNA-binding domain-containing protein [Planktosalinus lacus]